ncbi:period circadian protein [Euwallacea fornicatus]|uniref:period circadian protein n=1 Tax=Euwallacea fornicatus TaxID=995702 RepID=UPI00338EDD85
MESESGTNNTKISDSGYSNSCSNTTSQGSASSKSRLSGGSNSSRSSGYERAPSKQNQSDEKGHSQGPKRNKDREHKKKKQKSSTSLAVPALTTIPQAFIVPSETFSVTPAVNATSVEPTACPIHLETAVPETLETSLVHVDTALSTIIPLVTDDVGILESNITVVPDDKEVVSCGTENYHQLAKSVDDSKVEGDLLQFDVIPSSQPEVNDGFCCVISMYDGVVLYTTPSLTSILGFPEDMWLGHSFIDFVHPKDRDTFSSQISTSVNLPLVDSQGKVKDVKNYLYVCLKQYVNKDPSEVNVLEKPVSYQAFHLTVTIKRMSDSSETRLCDHNNNGLFLVILAVPVYSAYKVPGERKKSTKFGMRHTATCIFSYVDPDVVTSFGFLPQDMLGKSVFDFYHPEDMPFLKEVYKSVMKTCRNNGSVFRSKPYRFLVQNGCFAMIETEWSSVINPWSRQLEFVISLHQVLQGPLNPNVFDMANNKEFKTIPDEVIKQGNLLQGDIIQILTQELPKPAELGKQEVSKRCKDLANFMKSLMNSSKLEIDVPLEYNPSISERDSVMLGEISPHHDLYDSKSSSETPPSYSQLNYNENLCRFFQSNPKTTGTSDESNSASNVMETDGKNSLECAPTQKCLSPVQNSGASACGSAGNLSSGSNPNLESGTTSGTNISNDDYKPPQLTELVLVKHNEDMEKIMIQRHRKERSHIKDRQAKKTHQKLEKHTNGMLTNALNEHAHGVKRSGSHSWKDDCHKVSKHNHKNARNNITEDIGSNNKELNGTELIENYLTDAYLPPNANRTETFNSNKTWTPLSVPIIINSQTALITANTSCNPNMLPIYYVPALIQPRVVASNEDSPQKCQVQYMPAGLVCSYNPIFLPHPIFCSTVPIVSLPQPNLSSSGPPEEALLGSGINPPPANPNLPSFPGLIQQSNNSSLQSDQYHQCDNTHGGSNLLSQCDRPSSQATSVKAEPGSRIGSIASASVVNKALSECSRKDLGLQSVCSPDTPLVSPPDGETQAEQFSTNTKNMKPMSRPRQPENKCRINRMDEESSCYSSSYSSFLKTDTGSGSNDDSTSNNNSNKTDDEMLKQPQKVHPMRKKDPPWVESVTVSSDLIFKYQMEVKDLDDILKLDMNVLKKTEQPMMVNDQLHQLYIEMELEGLSKALTLEEGFSSNSNSSDETPSKSSNSNVQPRSKKRKSYSSLMMIYEENAPLPPPEANS